MTSLMLIYRICKKGSRQETLRFPVGFCCILRLNRLYGIILLSYWLEVKPVKEQLQEILDECRHYIEEGKVADYIPELAKANKNEFGICVMSDADTIVCAGDFQKKFTLQSIIKPLVLLLALMDNGAEKVRELVGVEATGKPFDAFNYSDQALRGEHINPMINTGAIALCTLVRGNTYQEKFERLLDLARTISGNPALQVDEQVYLSEKKTGNKNRALAYMLKAYDMLHDDVEDVLDFYFKACAIRASVVDLAKMAFVFANGGVDLQTGRQLFAKEYAQYVNAVLITCGMYDGSGDFAIRVGVPAKSGVGGGIMAIVPGKVGIGIYSPALNRKGNSLAGIKALELLSHKWDLSIF